MIKYECKIPQIDVNDKIIVVNDFTVKGGSFVEKNQTILALETAKAISEFYTEETGYIAYVVQEGDELTIGDTVAEIYDSAEEALARSEEIKNKIKANTKTYKATAKAEKMAQELGVDIASINKNGIIKEADVKAFYASKESK